MTEKNGAIIVEECELAGVPALLRYYEQTCLDANPIVLWHGFGPPSCEDALMSALPLDELPNPKIYLGLPMWGKRLPAGGVAELIRRQHTDYEGLIFEPVVSGAANELNAVLQALGERFSYSDGIGLFGSTNGGLATLLALVEKTVPIKAAVVVNSPASLENLLEFWRYFMRQSDRRPTPQQQGTRRFDIPARAGELVSSSQLPALLLLHGSADNVHSHRVSQQLYETLKPLYAEHNEPNRLGFEILFGFPHCWGNRQDYEPILMDLGQPSLVQSAVAHWFSLHLKTSYR